MTRLLPEVGGVAFRFEPRCDNSRMVGNPEVEAAHARRCGIARTHHQQNHALLGVVGFPKGAVFDY